MHLHIADVAVGQAVAEEEMAALLLGGALHFLLHLLHRKGVDVGDAHTFQLLRAITVVAAGGLVGLDDRAALRVDQQHGNLRLGKQHPVALCRFVQFRLCFVVKHGSPPLANCPAPAARGRPLLEEV
jgi:hypothetical protein